MRTRAPHLTTTSWRERVMHEAEKQARCQLESIVEMTDAVRVASNDDEREHALTRIYEDPLSVEVRGGWHEPGMARVKAVEFAVLLCTGGPAVRIRGELDEHCEPESAHIEYQDWFTPWEPLRHVTDAESDALLDYCRQLYFAD